MLLAIDIGNTNITLGVFQGDTLTATWRVATDPRRLSDEYGHILHGILPLRGITPDDITEVAICSVVPPLTSTFEEMSKTIFKAIPLVVTVGIKTGVRILYENPRDVGADRVVDAVAAYNLYGGPLIVVDFGTATVFDAIAQNGDYLGGAISPGLGVAAEALFLNTSQLRRVELVAPKKSIGRNTVASLQSGLVYGYVGLVENMIARFRKELGDDARVVATGGQAVLMAKETKMFDYVNPDLTLIGLRLIHELNQQDKETLDA
jgi:type III pantothenate kinase